MYIKFWYVTMVCRRQVTYIYSTYNQNDSKQIQSTSDGNMAYYVNFSISPLIDRAIKNIITGIEFLSM